MKTLNKIKNFLLTILGIFLIVELYRRFTSGEPVDTNIEDLKERIKQSENELNLIDSSKPEIDDIVDFWNDRK